MQALKSKVAGLSAENMMEQVEDIVGEKAIAHLRSRLQSHSSALQLCCSAPPVDYLGLPQRGLTSSN